MNILRKILFLTFLISYSISSQNSNYVFQENFDNNNGNWPVGSNENRVLSVYGGKYYFEHKRTKDSWRVTSSDFNLDTSKDFEIETSIQKISGVENSGISFYYDFKDSDNYREFGYSSNGYFRVAENKNKKYTTSKAWTKSDKIKTGNYGINTLKISRKGNYITFYINGSYVYSMTHKDYIGKKIGVAIYKNQKIAIDYLKVKNVSSTNFNNNNLVILNEDFNGNSSEEWSEAEDENRKFRLANGKYYLNHKRKEKGYLTHINKYFDSSKDFELETKLFKISGDTNSPYGILWGKKGDNYFNFLITSTGFYKVNRIVNNKIETILKWTKTDIINQGIGGANTLKIQKEDNYYKFYINNKYVTKIDFEPLFGNEIGYGIYYEQEIAVDYLKINSSIQNNKKTVVTNKTLSLPLYDSFSTNNNGWQTENSDDYSVALNGGKLIIERKKKGGIFISRNVAINTSKDFIIETSISEVKNSISGLYGITFGRKNSANEYSFLISGSSYLYRKFVENKYTKIIPFTESTAIKTGKNGINIIKIVKSGNLLRFYINNQYVNETAFEPFFGDKFGYTLYYDKKIAVDYLNIKYQTSSFNNPPIVAITEPNVDEKRGFKIVKTKRIFVRGKATDSDGIYEITINGIEANVKEDGTFTAQVPLKYGKNDLIVKATDLKQASSTKSFTIKRNSPEIITNNTDKEEVIDIGFGKYYALIIGVSTYNDKNIVDLKGEPTKDAQALADLLTSKYSFSRENVKVLKNPTENQIIREFFQLKNKVGKNDNVVIFYAGHGNYDQTSEKGYWMPADAQMEFEGNVILNTSIVSYIKSINSKHTLLIADACFSGSILSTNRSYSKASDAVKTKYSLPSRRAITSGTLTTVPNKSVFMKYLLKRLTQNTDPYLSAGKLFNMIEDPVINNTSGENKPQYAPINRTGDEGGDFIFIKKQ
ncbi:hypothetical protein [Polaribacter sp.]|uniref:hypothetical protein n=1 Tax=Polaribacter sp. TaxID=1920175 RepID=UPI003EF3142E